MAYPTTLFRESYNHRYLQSFLLVRSAAQELRLSVQPTHRCRACWRATLQSSNRPFRKTLMMLALWYMLYKPHKQKLLQFGAISLKTRYKALKPNPGPTVDGSLRLLLCFVCIILLLSLLYHAYSYCYQESEQLLQRLRPGPARSHFEDALTHWGLGHDLLQV